MTDENAAGYDSDPSLSYAEIMIVPSLAKFSHITFKSPILSQNETPILKCINWG